MARQRLTSQFFPFPKQVYFSEGNKKHAETVGKTLFGSVSAYVNALISKDRGRTPELGSWKSSGEARKRRLSRAKKEARQYKSKARRHAQQLKRRKQVA